MWDYLEHTVFQLVYPEKDICEAYTVKYMGNSTLFEKHSVCTDVVLYKHAARSRNTLTQDGYQSTLEI